MKQITPFLLLCPLLLLGAVWLLMMQPEMEWGSPLVTGSLVTLLLAAGTDVVLKRCLRWKLRWIWVAELLLLLLVVYILIVM